MTLSQVIVNIKDSLQAYMNARYNDVTVETYRLDSREMEQTNRYMARIAVYDGGDNATGQIPGAPQFSGDRVGWGYPLSTVQIIRFDLAVNIAERGQDGIPNEIELIALKDDLMAWVKTYGRDCLDETDAGIMAFMYGSSSGTSRLTKYAYNTVTCYCLYNPND